MGEASEAMRRYLAALREQSGLSWAELSVATGLPDSTIRKIFSGETADPRLETISLIVTAMGGSLDAMVSGDKKLQEENADVLHMVREDYEKRIAEIKASADAYAASLKRDKRAMSIVAGVLVLFLIVFLMLDVAFGSVGWIRY